MKYPLSLALAMLLIAVACSKPPSSQTLSLPEPTPAKETKEIQIVFPDLRLTIADADPADYRVSVKEGIATIEALSVGAGIDGKKILVEKSELNGLTSRIRYELGALQYLTDDGPAPSLDFSHETAWLPLDISNNVIQIPTHTIEQKK